MGEPNDHNWMFNAAALAFGAAIIATTNFGALAQPAPDKLAYGKHLSQECTTCHRRDGTDGGIPSIIGLKEDYFVATMKFYQTGARTNQTMNSVAQALNEEQLQALAAYFATLKPEPPAGRSAKAKK